MLSWFNGCSTTRRSLHLPTLLCAAVMATSAAVHAATRGGTPETGTRAIEDAYHQLVHELDLSRGVPSDGAVRRGVTAAAQRFQNAMKHDGGARPDLDADARNIIISLGDGTFSASRSIDALRRNAKGNVIGAEAWAPSLGGAPVPDTVGANLNQTGEGDCVGVSVVKAFSNTQAGSGILRRAVTQNTDGSYNVSLPGDPAAVQHLGSGDLNQYGKGDPAAAAVVGAMFRYFHLDPKTSALPTNKVMELLAGKAGDHARLADSETAPQGIVDFLARHADGVGNNVAMVFGGKPDQKGKWSKGDGHAFAVIHIDVRSGMLTYTNPWNQADPHTIALADLAQQAAGTSADFEIIAFR